MEKYEDIEAMNWSSLKNMATSPLLYKFRTENQRPDSPSLALGRAVHCAVLEPELFNERFKILGSDINLRTKAGKKKRDEIIESGVEFIRSNDLATVELCRLSVEKHEYASSALKNTDREKPITWNDPETGILCKGRLDAVNRSRVVDLKTTRSLSGFSRSVALYLYHGQAAWYLDGAIESGVAAKDAKFLFVAVESVEPFDCALFVLPDYVIEAGRSLYKRLLSMFVSCKEADIWPGMYPSPEPLDLPNWADGMTDEGEEI